MYNVFIFVFTFMIPLITTLVCYVRVIFKLVVKRKLSTQHREREVRKNSTSETPKNDRANSRMVSMLLMSVVAFVVTTVPNHIFALWTSFQSEDDSNPNMKSTFLLLHAMCPLIHVHGWLNPVIYCIFDRTFRQNVIAAFSHICRKEEKLTRSRNNTIRRPLSSLSSKSDDNILRRSETVTKCLTDASQKPLFSSKSADSVLERSE